MHDAHNYAVRACGRRLAPSVEVGGIEPPSAGTSSGLLRAQSAERSARPRRSRELVADGPSCVKLPASPATWLTGSGFLNDARHRSGSYFGLTDYATRLGSESEIGAVLFGTYYFTEGVNEITLHSRPASPDAMTGVETDHPRIHLPSRRHARA